MNLKKKIPPTLYDEIFPCTMKMENLEILIQKRYELLKEIEKRSFMKDIGVFNSIYLQYFQWDTEEGIANDLASHFILSLVYCKYDSDRSWFSLQESRLFHNRLVYPNNYDIPETLKKMGIPLYKVEENKLDKDLMNKIHFKTALLPSAPTFNTVDPNKEGILYIPFQYALKLIPTRKYFLYKGNIYISESEVETLIENVFNETCMTHLLKIHTKFDMIYSDSRIKHILLQFERHRELVSAAKTSNDPITNEFQAKTGKDIDNIAERTFPLCMLMIQRHINQNAHLKHIGRLQYTLFLKAIGLPLEEAMGFFRRKYERKTPADKFEKMYAYNIRHTYGLEGKRSDYSSYSCKKIMMSLPNPSSDECHGCPFKTYTEDAVKKLLFSLGFKEKDVLTILEKKRTNEFPICCIRAFEAKFPGCSYEKVGENPFHYFTSAMKTLSKKKIEYDKDKGRDCNKDNSKTVNKQSGNDMVIDSENNNGNNNNKNKNNDSNNAGNKEDEQYAKDIEMAIGAIGNLEDINQ